MKLVIRADDIGYSKICNLGSFEAIENGIVTSADIMLDTPGSLDALERLRSYPWISIGWHTHFWGCPVLGGNQVPTLFDPVRNGFRTDLYTARDVSYDEALAECRAQLDLCLQILGRVPDVGGSLGGNLDTPFVHALNQVHREYHIVTNFMGTDLGPGMTVPASEPKWATRKIFCRGLIEYCIPLRAAPLASNGWTDSISALQNYDPIRFYIEDESHMLDKDPESITVHAWHPGYVDYYVYRHGDYSAGAPVFKDIRTVDVHALCSPEVREWIVSHHIELINMRDALYGTNEYQNHLRAIGSNLAI